MDDALVVGGFERIGDLPRDVERGRRSAPAPTVGRARTRARALGERLALDQLQNQDTRTSGRLLEAVDRAMLRMIERRQHPRFALEPRQPIGIGGEGGGRTLMATSRPSLVSRARYTSPMPPTPSSACT